MARYVLPTSLVLLFIGYFSLQVCPTFYYWDSAELSAAVASGGVPHPPGFPLLLILGKIFIAIMPFSDGRALNLFSAFFAVVGLALWYFVIRSVLQSFSDELPDPAVGLFSFLGAVILGVSFSYGIQAVRFEVYSLSFAFFALMFLTALGIFRSEKKTTGRLLVPALAVGLAIGTHILTVVLVLPGIAILVLLSRPARIRRFPGAAVVALLGAAVVYCYIFYLARQQPILNWGDPSGFRRFFDYLTAREFTTSISSFGLGHVIANLVFAAGLIVRQFGLPASIFAVWGLYNLARHRRRIGYPLLLMLVLNLFSIIFSEDFYYENYDQHGYLLISLAVVALSVAAGLQSLCVLLTGFMKRRGSPDPLRKALYLALLAAILVYAYPLRVNMFAADLSDVYGAEDYAHEFLACAPDKAVIITSYYNTYFCLLAHRAIIGGSDSLTVVNLYDWDHRWGREDARRRYREQLNVDTDRQTFYRNFLNAVMKDVPIYVEYDESSAPLAKYLLPDGPGYILTAPDTSVISAGIVPDEINGRLAELTDAGDLETVKTWLLWFQNRGLFYEHRGLPDARAAYFAAAESLAVRRNR